MLLVNQIWQCLDLGLLDGALFLAEQLVANDDQPDACHLLGVVLLRRGQFVSAQTAVNKHLAHVGCLWVYAQSLLMENKPLAGLEVLERYSQYWALGENVALPCAFLRSELTPAAFYLLRAQLKKRTSSDAVADLAQSCELNPFLVENALALARTPDVRLQSSELLARFDIWAEIPGSAMSSAGSSSLVAPVALSVTNANANANETTTKTATGGSSNTSTSVPAPVTISTPFNGRKSTPRRVETPHRVFSTPKAPPPPPAPPAPLTNVFAPSPSSSHLFSGPNATFAPFGMFQTPYGPNTLGHGGSIVPHRRGQDRPERVHSLSFRRGAPSNSIGGHFDQTSLSSLGKGVFAALDAAAAPDSSTAHLTAHSTTHLTAHYDLSRNDALVRILDAVNLAAQAQFAEAAQVLRQLSAAVRDAPFVLALNGRIHLELCEYELSVTQFERLREVQPDRGDGLEHFSTALWHLKRESALARLGYEVTNQNSPLRRSWQSWCALGNAFSVKNDSQRAIECFERAVQLEPQSAYCRVLLGYELHGSQELRSAADCFSAALARDPYLYNAWYGLGTVYFELGDYDRAAVHFSQAIRLNPRNPVLLCFMGTVYDVQGRSALAMQQFDHAMQLNPRSPIPRYRKAEILIDAQMFREALEELTVLETLAPEDSSVHVALARAYSGLGLRKEAVRHATVAMDLRPNNPTLIKQVLESA